MKLKLNATAATLPRSEKNTDKRQTRKMFGLRLTLEMQREADRGTGLNDQVFISKTCGVIELEGIQKR